MEETHFGGAVRKRRLPQVQPGAAEAPALKRLMLPQGELAQVLDGTEPVRYLACLELRPGVVRGNHYHKIKKEYLYIIDGRVELAIAPAGGGEKVILTAETGDLIFIDTGLAHALKAVSGGMALEFSSAAFDASDVCRVGSLFG